ncbi:hypothetical protein EK904_011804 [Melospiza melodia maxima]|nr:hypothetical protein EK904_011804 [Melospiza melodia maxima]
MQGVLLLSGCRSAEVRAMLHHAVKTGHSQRNPPLPASEAANETRAHCKTSETFTVPRSPAVLGQDRCTTHSNHSLRGQQNTRMCNPTLPLKQTEEHRPPLFAEMYMKSKSGSENLRKTCKVECCPRDVEQGQDSN